MDKKEYCKKYYILHKDDYVKYRQSHKEIYREGSKKFRETHKGYYKKYSQEYGIKYRQENKDKLKKQSQEYYQKNKDRIKERTRKWYKNNIISVNETKKKYNQSHKEQTRDYKKKHRLLHLDEYRKRANEWAKRNYKMKWKKDIKYNLDTKMAVSIRESLKGNKKGWHWETLVGYTTEQLKEHIQKRFKKGMTWKKFLNGEIHIHHKVPKNHFKYNTPEDPQFKYCWALHNLDPMWAKENKSLSDRNYQLPLFI